jgi:hypothetical protein
MKPLPTFSVSVKLWLHSDLYEYIWVLPFWTQRILRVSVWGPSGMLVKEQGSLELVSDYGHRGSLLRPRCIWTARAWNPINNLIKSNMTRITGTSHQDLCAFITSPWHSSWNDECFRQQLLRKSKYIFMFNNIFFPESCAVYDIMWENMVQPERLQITV